MLIEKPPKCPSTNEWIMNMCSMECYSAMEKKEVLPFAIPQVDLKSIMLSEISHIEKETLYVIT